MPFKSKAQQRFMYANKKKMKSQGVDVDEWSSKTDFSKLPEKAKKKAVDLAVDSYLKVGQKSEGRRLMDELRQVKDAAGHDLATVEDVDQAVAAICGRSHDEAAAFDKAASDWIEKNSASSWAKKLAKKYKDDGKTVPDWLNKLSGGKQEKKAFIGRAMAGLGSRMARGGVGRMFGGRVGRMGAKMGLTGMGRSLGKNLIRRGGLMEAGGGLRGMMSRNPLWTAAGAGGLGLLGGSMMGGGGSAPPADPSAGLGAAGPAGPQMQPQIDPRTMMMLQMLMGGQRGFQYGGWPKMGMEKNAVLGIGALGRRLAKVPGLRRVGGGAQRLNSMLGGTAAGRVLNRIGSPLQAGARNVATGAQGTVQGLRSRFGRAGRQARRARREARRADKLMFRPNDKSEAALAQEMMSGPGDTSKWKSLAPGGKGFIPSKGMPWGVGKALKGGLRYGMPVAGGALLGANLAGGEQPSAEEQVAGTDQPQPDFVQRMMGGLGDYVGGDLGLESLGGMIKDNPYASLGVGVGGGGLLMYLLYKLLSGGGGQQQMMPAYG